MFVYALAKKAQQSKSKSQSENEKEDKNEIKNVINTTEKGDVNITELEKEISASCKQQTVETFVDKNTRRQRKRKQRKRERQLRKLKLLEQSSQYDSENSLLYKKTVTSRDRCVMAMCAFSLLSFSFINAMMSLVSITLTFKYPFLFDQKIRERIMNSILIGELFGILFSGLIFRFTDKLTLSIISSGLTFVATVLATASQGSTTYGMFWMMSICLGAAGFGLGGQMVSACTLLIKAVNNYKNAKTRARRFIMCSNLPLASGLFISCLVYLITWRATGQGKHMATSWRVVFGISAIFPFVTLISSLIMKFIFKDYEGENSYWIPLRITTRYYGKRLIATCITWFIYGFVHFPSVPYLGVITQAAFQTLTIDATAQWALLIASFSIPGVFLGFNLIKTTLSQRSIILFGFAAYFVIGLILGCGYTVILSKVFPLFLVLYGLFKSLGNVGPGNLTILYSCELFADCVRGLFFSFSAASGTVGAIVGFNVYEPIINNIGIRWFYIISALISIIGFVLSFFFLPKLPEQDIDNENSMLDDYIKSTQNNENNNPFESSSNNE
ncbi:transporter activity protein [[Candida] boidinii]|nr:transporter activity protein [[Candida] boidinii]